MSAEESPPGSPSRPARKQLSRAIVNFWLDLVLFLTVTFIVWTSVMLQVVFPAPTAADGWTLWGMTYNQWRDIQFTALCVGALCAIEHLVLHWNWVCSIIATKVLRTKNRPDEASQAIYGVGTFILLVAFILGSLALAIFSVRRPPY